jgi:hypothetical protein
MSAFTPTDLAFQSAGRFLSWTSQEAGTTTPSGAPVSGNSGVRVANHQEAKVVVSPNGGATISFRVWLEWEGRQGFALVDGLENVTTSDPWTQELNVSGASRLYVEITSIDIGSFDVDTGVAVLPLSNPVILPQFYPNKRTLEELALEGGTVGLFHINTANADGIVDLTGTVASGEYSILGEALELIPDSSWGKNRWAVSQSVSQANFALTGNVNGRGLYQFNGDVGNGAGDVVKADGAGEDFSNNGLYTIRLISASQVDFLSEYGAGSNTSVTFDFPSPLVLHETFTISFSLSDNGDGTSNLTFYKNGSRLLVATGSDVSFVNNGDSATITTPEGDLSDTVDAALYIGSTADSNRIKLLQMRGKASSDIEEQEFAAKFGLFTG